MTREAMGGMAKRSAAMPVPDFAVGLVRPGRTLRAAWSARPDGICPMRCNVALEPTRMIGEVFDRPVFVKLDNHRECSLAHRSRPG